MVKTGERLDQFPAKSSTNHFIHPIDYPVGSAFPSPSLAFGSGKSPMTKWAAVAEAVRLGYRAINTAQGYDNEPGGAAIRALPIEREDHFITSKLRTKSMG